MDIAAGPFCSGRLCAASFEAIAARPGTRRRSMPSSRRKQKRGLTWRQGRPRLKGAVRLDAIGASASYEHAILRRTQQIRGGSHSRDPRRPDHDFTAGRSAAEAHKSGKDVFPGDDLDVGGQINKAMPLRAALNRGGFPGLFVRGSLKASRAYLLPGPPSSRNFGHVELQVWRHRRT